ncbi:uncharacterized protein LOC127761620 [Oryza glaberrima]|uniref:uncharacterized protein LOC127761620 n=1 Tax=Oryza glaberrima TaxID=4538 RepID=UPI00224C3B92|nr:uncharacterized protein LOC127761620 [Oryza glaberrima]
MAAAAADAAMAAGLAEREPAWLRSLLGARFFEACAAHRGMSRNECNQYCLTCAAAADDAGGAAAVGCQWCVVAAHGGGAGRDRGHRHRVVQVRRSSYHNVVRVSELERALDLTRVQTYVINRDRVVFLNERPQAPRNGRCAAAAAVACAACEACGRGLLDVAFRFCSLGCKVRAPAAGRRPRSFPFPAVSATVFAVFGPRPRRRVSYHQWILSFIWTVGLGTNGPDRYRREEEMGTSVCWAGQSCMGLLSPIRKLAALSFFFLEKFKSPFSIYFHAVCSLYRASPTVYTYLIPKIDFKGI